MCKRRYVPELTNSIWTVNVLPYRVSQDVPVDVEQRGTVDRGIGCGRKTQPGPTTGWLAQARRGLPDARGLSEGK